MNALFKTGTKLLNALAFANVGNLNEFHALLRQNEEQRDSDSSATGSRQVSAAPQRPAITPAIRHMQQAL